MRHSGHCASILLITLCFCFHTRIHTSIMFDTFYCKVSEGKANSAHLHKHLLFFFCVCWQVTYVRIINNNINVLIGLFSVAAVVLCLNPLVVACTHNTLSYYWVVSGWFVPSVRRLTLSSQELLSNCERSPTPGGVPAVSRRAVTH